MHSSRHPLAASLLPPHVDVFGDEANISYAVDSSDLGAVGNLYSVASVSLSESIGLVFTGDVLLKRASHWQASPLTSNREKSSQVPASFPSVLAVTPAFPMLGLNSRDGTVTSHEHRTKQSSNSQSHASSSKKRSSLQALFAPSFMLSTLPNQIDIRPTGGSRTRSKSSVTEIEALQFYPQGSNHQVNKKLLRTISSRRSSRSGKRSPPPPFLLDDDPFANLTASPRIVSSMPSTPSPGSQCQTPIELLSPDVRPSSFAPRSPLSPATFISLNLDSSSDSTMDVPPRISSLPTSEEYQSVVKSSPLVPTAPPASTTVTHVARPGVIHQMSSGHSPRPAYQRPAFAPRPSLPSLRTLAEENVVIPKKKVRKGRVGASLPFEPWALHHKDTSSDPVEDQNVYSDSHGYYDLDLDVMADTNAEDGDCNTKDVMETETFDDNGQSSWFVDNSPEEESICYGIAVSDEVQLLDDLENPQPLGRIASGDSLPSLASSHSGKRHPSPTPTADMIEDGQTDNDLFAYDFEYDSNPPSGRVSESWTDMEWSSGSTSPFHDSGPTPFTSPRSSCDVSWDETNMMFEPGSSVGTIRASPLDSWVSRRRGMDSVRGSCMEDVEVVDGGGWGEQAGRSHIGRWGGSDQSTGGANGHQDPGDENGAGDAGIDKGGSGSGGGGDDGDDGRRENGRSSFSTPTDSDESNPEDSEDDYGGEDSLPAAPSAHEDPGTGSGPSTSGTPTDDDVPLAQRIPTALKAQKTIRRQVRDEREARRKERQRQDRTRETARSPPHGLVTSEPDTAISKSQQGSMHPTRSEQREQARPSPDRRFAIEDLTQKLLSVQATDSTPSALLPHKPSANQSTSRDHLPQTSAAVQGIGERSTRVPDAHRDGALRPMRSFHRSQVKDLDGVRKPDGNGRLLGRSVTSDRPRRRPDESLGSYGAKLRPSQDDAHSGVEKALRSRSHEDGKRTRRTSADEAVPHQRNSHRPPVPPMPADVPASFTKSEVYQQRIFIGDKDRFNMIEVSPLTSAQDVLDLLKSEGAFDNIHGTGEWMVYEVAQDFGMERPIRGYELLSDITSSWNQDKLINTFVTKMTPLAPLLSRSAIPSSSPTHRGWVEWEYKRGRWAKRWMELREHSLWLAKRDTGKDETFMCSMSNFDAYFVTRAHKGPKRFVFAVKSTDNLSFFENTADYVHIFSCGQKEGEQWIQKILLARSYVLHQEKNVLFTKGTGITKASSRQDTRKPPSQRLSPLVNVSTAFTTTSTTTAVFEPGSLLAKRGDA